MWRAQLQLCGEDTSLSSLRMKLNRSLPFCTTGTDGSDSGVGFWNDKNRGNFVRAGERAAGRGKGGGRLDGGWREVMKGR